MSIAREIHRTHQRATAIHAAAQAQCSKMVHDHQTRQLTYCFGDGSTLVITNNRVIIEERA